MDVEIVIIMTGNTSTTHTTVLVLRLRSVGLTGCGLLKYFQSLLLQSQHPFHFTVISFYVDIHSQSTGVVE